VLFPGDGLARIYESDDALFSVFTNILTTW
jgi:hypothetical protein